MFKSIAMAVLALSMTVEGTVTAGQDLYQVQQEVQQEVQQRKAEEALDDDTTCLEENPEAYMTDDETQDDYTTVEAKLEENYQNEHLYGETREEYWNRKCREIAESEDMQAVRELEKKYPNDYRGNSWQHRGDAEDILTNIYRVNHIAVSDMMNHDNYATGTVTVPGLGELNFTLEYDEYGPTIISVPSEDGMSIKVFYLDRELNIVSYAYMN